MEETPEYDPDRDRFEDMLRASALRRLEERKQQPAWNLPAIVRSAQPALYTKRYCGLIVSAKMGFSGRCRDEIQEDVLIHSRPASFYLPAHVDDAVDPTEYDTEDLKLLSEELDDKILVHLVEGAHKADIVQALRRLADVVDRDWDEIIGRFRGYFFADRDSIYGGSNADSDHNIVTRIPTENIYSDPKHPPTQVDRDDGDRPTVRPDGDLITVQNLQTLRYRIESGESLWQAARDAGDADIEVQIDTRYWA